MSKCEKLLEKAKRSAANLRFGELRYLAECHGWLFQRQSGSHLLFVNESLGNSPDATMNFQSQRGRAKPYQVKQLLEAIEGLDGDEE